MATKKAASPVTTDPSQTVEPDSADVTTFEEDDDPEAYIGDEVKD